jgi:hypothetical protein
MKVSLYTRFRSRALVAAVLCSCAAVATAQQSGSIGGFSRCDIGLGVTPIAFTATDLNNDGSVDLAIIGSNGQLITLLGNATAFQNGDCAGATTRPADTSLPLGPVVIAAGDVTGDAKADLVIGGGAGAALLVGDGTGRFTTLDLHASSDVQAVVIADLNRDGQPDLIAGNGSNHNVTMFPGQPGGLGSEVQIGSTGANAPDGPIDLLVVGDFNNDGLPDVAAASTVRSSIWLLLQQRTTPATFVTLKYVMQTQPPSALTAGFFDNDLFPDLAVTTVGPDALIVLRNQISEQTLFSPVSTGTGTAPLALAANNPCDQCRDPVYLAVANHDDSTVAFYTTDSSGNPSEAAANCSAAEPASGRCTTDAGPRAVVLADVDGDNRSDVITANQTGQSMTVLLSSQPVTIFTPTPAATPTTTPTTTATTTPGGDCCSAHGGPNCDNTACRDCVCQLLLSCCSASWDARCAALANGAETSPCTPACLCGVPTQTATASPTITATGTETATPSATATGPSPTSTLTPTTTLQPTLTATPTMTPTFTQTATRVLSFTPTPTIESCLGSICVQGKSCAVDAQRGDPANGILWLLPPAALWFMRRCRSSN